MISAVKERDILDETIHPDPQTAGIVLAILAIIIVCKLIPILFPI